MSSFTVTTIGRRRIETHGRAPYFFVDVWEGSRLVTSELHPTRDAQTDAHLRLTAACRLLAEAEDRATTGSDQIAA